MSSSKADTPAATSGKLVPPTLTPDLFSRRVIVACFWIVALFGVPIWWHTTNIERLSLPTEEVLAWSRAGECPIKQPISINLAAQVQMSEVDGPSFASELSRRLRELPAAKCLDFRIGLVNSDALGEYTVELVSSGVSEVVGRRATILTEEAPSVDSVFESLKTLLNLGSAEVDPRVVKFASRYKLAFSLLNQDSTRGGALLDWDIQRLIQDRLRPLLDSLSPLHSFTLESQIQYFAPLSVQVSQESGTTIVEEDDLRAFVNSAEWNLASVTMDTTLHFLLYVPSLENRPMRIRSTSGSLASSNGFISPQWGGVVIHNPTSVFSDAQNSNDSLDSAFLLFEQQLQKLFGVSQSGHQGALSQWQVDALVRKRLMEAVKESVETLEAIIKLAEQIPNMRIGKEVQRGVRLSLNELDEARKAIASSPEVALKHASAALELASKAYFNPTMLALLYFPDEHKYAVYTPLFGPIAVPMVAALLREWKLWKEKRRNRKEAKDKVE